MNYGGKRAGAGRKKGSVGTHTLEAVKAREFIALKVSQQLGLIVDTAIVQAKKGDSEARKWLADRAWGRPKDTSEITVVKPFSLVALAERWEERKREASNQQLIENHH